ncbi:Ribosomal large subunit pseudouridine synthase D [Poriferisphaera corsica]|uniref:Ribosomal large subunit pseudouridine synthase D n=1 Tax=Poriferisphaera corsica TaxID=2528020 RepID=A0A517YS76_9BACT|nr:RluA family pseudouridine synthase [Poriferisphaera corsica]QDU33075.1 Ribosomal large subunit pseudouridine synthase D [Poriferisphaera corsica]
MDKTVPTTRTYTVTNEHDGSRLDQFIGSHLELSRNQVKRLLEAGLVSLNNRSISATAKGKLLRTGSTLTIQLNHLETSSLGAQELILPEHIPLASLILTQTQDAIIINKPAGMPVHPLKLGETGTALNAIVDQYPAIQGIGEGGLRSGVVHRLDVTTSGTLLVALMQPAWEYYRQAFANHQTEKVYHALVQGRINTSQQLTAHLGITQHKPAKITVFDIPPKHSHVDTRICDLSYSPIRHFENATLLRISLGTGFLHQIRAMLSHIGYPILGDSLYNGPTTVMAHSKSVPFPVSRPMLHAYSLALDNIRAQAPYPQDFQNLMNDLN